GVGNSNMATQYTFEDRNPIQGVAYYRLGQQDFDGSYQQLSVIELVLPENIPELAMKVFPNPFEPRLDNKLKVEISGQNSSLVTHISLIDPRGSLIASWSEANPEGLTVPTQISPGIYFLRVFAGDYISNKMIQIQ
ncbi:MAG: T9SS type A sorting domain-containing protein, partial [Bacteroidota bacterium]